jgi:class II lanthipeptide synthase
MARLDAAACLETAVATARTIAADAVWHERRCSWIGGMPEEGPGGTIAMTYQALGADLYGGTAGVGLFLAEVAHVCDDSDVRACALGALRHAASRADSVTGVGLYGGRYGIALALAGGAVLLGVDELDAAAQALAHADLDAGEEFDLISGDAGAIVALLALSNVLDDASLAERAVVHGERLLERGTAADGTLSWQSPTITAKGGLAGFSHGAAGAATALLELAAATGDERYAEAASRAFAYEATLYDDDARNWPDLRENSAQPASGTLVFVTFWCHGAPGIALSRLRALELGAGDDARTEADVALETTEAWVDAALRVGLNYSICHGLAGNAEILREGGRAQQLVEAVALRGIETYADRGLRWPSGAHGAPTPSLFLGDAGTGRFYLRLARPEVPSLLLVRPDALASALWRSTSSTAVSSSA